jgi:hypothetical protein
MSDSPFFVVQVSEVQPSESMFYRLISLIKVFGGGSGGESFSKRVSPQPPEVK